MTFFTRILYLGTCFLLFILVPLRCQDAEIFPPSKVKRAIESKKIEKSIRIDGMLNEEEWNLVQIPLLDIPKIQNTVSPCVV